MMRASRFQEELLRRRGPFLTVVAVVTVLAAIAYARLPVENNIHAWCSASDPEYVRYLEFRQLFESEETMFVVLRAPDIFTREVLAHIDRLTRAMEAAPHVSSVTSLTNIEDITGTADGLFIDPLVPTTDLDDRELETLRRRVLDDPFFPGVIVSSDGRTTVVVAEVDRSTSQNDAAVVDAIETALTSDAPPDIEQHLAGWVPVNVLMNRLTLHDVRQGFPLTMIALGLSLVFMFRSIRAVIIINLAVMLAVFWTMGSFAALGFNGTSITVSALPGILLALTVATGVHVVARFYEARTIIPDPALAMREALPRVATPVIITCVTTAIGFGSLVVAYMAPVQHLGLFAGFGMAYTCFICLTVVPIALVAFPPRRQATPNPRLERALIAVADFDARHPRGILAAGVIVVMFAAIGIAQLQPQGTNLNYLPSDSPPVEAMRFIEKHFGGASTLDVVVSGPPDALKDPVTARTVAAIQDLLASYPETTGTIAYTDLLRRMNRALHDGAPEAYRIPDTMRAIAQELLLYETSGGTELPTLLDVNGYDTARVRAFATSFMAMQENQRLFDEVSRRLQTVAVGSGSGGPPLAARIAGDWSLWLRMNLSLMTTMSKSFTLAFVGVTVMMILLTRSVRMGLLAMIPNAAPVLIGIGTLGWLGIELDFATVMVAGIALGIAVDDTIHYLFRFRHELATVGDRTLAMRRTHASVGKAMVTTSVVLFLGFGSMLTSAFPPHQLFGAILALTMVAALAADLILLPALLHVFPRSLRS